MVVCASHFGDGSVPGFVQHTKVLRGYRISEVNGSITPAWVAVIPGGGASIQRAMQHFSDGRRLQEHIWNSSTRAASSRALDVSEADIVISGGRGMGGPEHWPILEDLVAVLGSRATLACSRPVSDAGWRPPLRACGTDGPGDCAGGLCGVRDFGGDSACGGHPRFGADHCHQPGCAGSDFPGIGLRHCGGTFFTVVPALTRAIAALQEGP